MIYIFKDTGVGWFVRLLDGRSLDAILETVSSGSKQFTSDFAGWYYFTNAADRCLLP
jgi:hypothetical protein